MSLLSSDRHILGTNGDIGRDVESQAIVLEQCTFQGDDRIQSLLARTHFHKSVAGLFPTVLVSDDVGVRYGAISSE